MPNDDVSVVPDPFTDDLFAPLDTRGEGSLQDELDLIASQMPDVTQDGTPPEPAADSAATPPTPPVVEEPKVYEYPDGSSVTIEKGSRGWKATLDTNTGAPAEVFYGSTKEELLLNVSAGKMNATRKIREMNKRIKLEGGDSTPAPSVPAAPAPAASRVLTADEIFEIKTDLASNPDLAMEKWFQKKTGMSVAELVKLAQIGKAASDELSAESVSRDFLTRHPEYVAYEKNFNALISWLCKYKLHQPLNGRDPNEMIQPLFVAGCWTDQSLDEAYDDLASDGLLDLRSEDDGDEEPVDPEPVPAAPVTPPAPPAPAAPVTPPAAPSSRIASTKSRPRAGQGNLGIRSRETTGNATSPDDMRPPSDEELNNLTDAEVSELLAGIRKSRLGTRR